MDQLGFVPPDLTHPAEWLVAWHLALRGGAWAVMALAAFGLVIAAIAWATRREGGSPADAVAAGWLGLAGALPRAGLAAALLAGAFAACGTLASRAHDLEFRARTSALENYPDVKMIQAAPRFGHVEVIKYKDSRWANGKRVEVDAERREERFHYLAGSDVRAEIRRVDDPVREGLDRFAVAFDATYRLANPLGREQAFFLDLAPPASANVVFDLAVEAGGKALSPESEGGTRYWLTLPAGGHEAVRYRYHADGVPRWVYDTAGARLSAFKLTIATDLGNAKFASGVAPTRREPWQGGQALTWEYAKNGQITEPLGIFTAMDAQAKASTLPRWLLLAPGLLALWLAVLALTTRLRARDMAIAAALFGAAVLTTYAAGRSMPPAFAWLVAGAVVAFLAGELDDDGATARTATALALVLPGVAVAVQHAAVGGAAAALVLAAWLARRRPKVA